MDRKQLINDLIAEEGCVLHAYADSLGFWTIGVGRLIDKRRGGGITQEEAMFFLGNDIDKVYAGLKAAFPWFINKPDNVQRALCDMAFQMGIPGLQKFTTTLSLIEQGKYKEAAESALKSKWASQTPNRAKRVTSLLTTQGASNV